jgi:hypothetical protein
MPLPSGRTRAERLEVERLRRRSAIAIVAFALLMTAAVLWLLGLSGARLAI